MKSKTQLEVISTLPLKPSSVSSLAVKSHINKIAKDAKAKPGRWEADLETNRADLKFGIEMQEADARLASARIATTNLPADEKRAAQEQLKEELESARLMVRVGDITARIVKAAVSASHAVNAVNELTSEIEKAKEREAIIRAEMHLLENPIEDARHLLIEELKKEEDLAVRTWNEHSSDYTEVLESHLRELVKAGEFKGQPTSRGYSRRLSEIQEEIQAIEEQIQQAASEKSEQRDPNRYGDLIKEVQVISDRLIQAGYEMEGAATMAREMEADLDVILKVGEMEAEVAVYCYESDKKVRALNS